MRFRRLASKMEYMVYALRARAMRPIARMRTSPGNNNSFIVLDPALIGYNGHHAEFARLLKAELGSSSSLAFYANFKADSALLLELRAQPVFWDSGYAFGGDFPEIYRSLSRSFSASLSRIHASAISRSTCVLIHTTTVYHLGGLAQWYASLPEKLRPRIFLQFQFPIEFQVDREYHERAVGEARDAVRDLANNGFVRLASNSRHLADKTSQQMGQPCALMPLPVRWPRLVDPTAFSQPSFGFFGGLREEKGASLIAEALPKFAARYPDCRFIVHAPAREADRAAVTALKGAPGIELITYNFRRKSDYFAALRQVACILLPYSPSAYAVRTSGIFLEAIGLGHFIVTTQGTWMASELQDEPRASVAIMPEFTADALYKALERARSALLERPFVRTPSFNVINKNNPAAFCAALQALMDVKASGDN